MKRKGDAYETLSLFFKRDVVPPKTVMDASKEQTLGSFRKKCQEADFHIKQTEPYSPWQLQSEGTIRDMKKGDGRKMVWADAPKWIRNKYLYFETYVRSNISLDIYMLQGEVP